MKLMHGFPFGVVAEFAEADEFEQISAQFVHLVGDCRIEGEHLVQRRIGQL